MCGDVMMLDPARTRTHTARRVVRLPDTMAAAAIDRFGGPEASRHQRDAPTGSTLSMAETRSSYMYDPSCRRPLMKNVGVPFTPSESAAHKSCSMVSPRAGD
jgi:hypothetical protein